MLNKQASPCIRALMTERTAAIAEEGRMDFSVMGAIKDLYFGGDMESSVALAGQSAGLIDEVRPVEAIINDMIAEFHAITGRLGGLAATGGF